MAQLDLKRALAELLVFGYRGLRRVPAEEFPTKNRRSRVSTFEDAGDGGQNYWGSTSKQAQSYDFNCAMAEAFLARLSEPSGRRALSFWVAVSNCIQKQLDFWPGSSS